MSTFDGGFSKILGNFRQSTKTRVRIRPPKSNNTFALEKGRLGLVRCSNMAPTTTTPSPSSRTITLDDLTVQNIGLLKKLNTVLFPVPYSEKFYKESLHVGELAKLGECPL